MNHRSAGSLERELDMARIRHEAGESILDRITMPQEGQEVAVMERTGRITIGTYAGTIPGKHDASDWFRRHDRWIIVEDSDNVAHIPTDWIRQAVVQKTD